MFAKAWATANLVGLSLVFSQRIRKFLSGRSRRRANRRKRLSDGGAGRVASRAVKRLGERSHGRSRRRADRRKRLSDGGAGRVVSRAVKRLGERSHGRSRRCADRRKGLSDRSLGRLVFRGNFQRFNERLNGRTDRAPIAASA